MQTLRSSGVGQSEPEREQDGRQEDVRQPFAGAFRPRHVQRLVFVLVVVVGFVIGFLLDCAVDDSRDGRLHFDDGQLRVDDRLHRRQIGMACVDLRRRVTTKSLLNQLQSTRLFIQT